ncbi:MAG TPA: hypothetical protein DEB39_09580, partial [Planctomycetaceae bacterium]|nr:hypothetical protein [Planctomycetaceae bacterium]
TYRSANLLSTRSTLLHEATHAYHDKYFPGAFRAYPDWFQECFAKHFEDHSWNGKQLRLDGMPPFTRRKYAENAIPVLLDFRDWIKAKQGVPPAATADAGETEQKKGRVEKNRPRRPPHRKRSSISPSSSRISTKSTIIEKPRKRIAARPSTKRIRSTGRSGNTCSASAATRWSSCSSK